ncbi:MAG: M20 family metallopeptidase [Clostridiales bacterium]|nr:M20 family metallopeptidase [Clostridiales bacterium]MDO4351025.1 M20 family metallopeptidase [Eubacteriales bacterium]MDY4008293.1 M20 family metallopeptidase [Candidatus Limiplasma sp.]
MSVRDTILAYADKQAGVYQQIALDIHARPEVSNYEFFASETLSRQLEKEGFQVKLDVAGHRTGFTAAYKSAKPGPVVVFLAEYDALGGLGHGCGHNLFGATSSLAGAALKQVIDEVGGEVRVYGTPGEEGGENGSAKGSFVREGFLNDVDVALCAHPSSGPHMRTSKLLGVAPVDIEFWGKAAHAASAPQDGVNALDALILTYNGINALRQHLTSDVRIHGIIVKGGDAPNTVPDYAHAKFYLRAASAPTMDEVYAKVERIVEGAALMTGAKGRMQLYQNRVENMVRTPLLDDVYCRVMESLGQRVEAPEPDEPIGSSDVGNISQVAPTIQPYITISDEAVAGHSEAFKAAACSRKGLDSIPLGAKALALTALEVIQHPDELAAIKAQHARAVREQ